MAFAITKVRRIPSGISSRGKKPSRLYAYYLIDKIFGHRGVTEVPGFENLKSFSQAFESEMVSYLSRTQIMDTLQAWRGLHPVTATPEFMKTQAERIFNRVAVQDKVQYLALKNVDHWYVTHAWLIVSAVKMAEKIVFYYMDSEDHPITVPDKFVYTPGDTSFAGFVPYLQYESDDWAIDKAVKQYCR